MDPSEVQVTFSQIQELEVFEEPHLAIKAVAWGVGGHKGLVYALVDKEGNIAQERRVDHTR